MGLGQKKEKDWRLCLEQIKNFIWQKIYYEKNN